MNDFNSDIKPKTAYTFRIWGKGHFHRISLWSNGTKIIPWPVGTDTTTDGALLGGEFIDWHLGYSRWTGRAASFTTEHDTESIMLFIRSAGQLPEIGLIELYKVGSENEIDAHITF